jgi:hypothetical protein
MAGCNREHIGLDLQLATYLTTLGDISVNNLHSPIMNGVIATPCFMDNTAPSSYSPLRLLHSHANTHFLTICCTADFDTVCHTSSFRYTHAAIRAASAIRCWLVLARASPGFDCHATWRYVIHQVSPSSTIAPRLVPTGPFNLRSPLGPHPKAPAFRLFNHEGVRPRGYVGQR